MIAAHTSSSFNYSPSYINNNLHFIDGQFVFVSNCEPSPHIVLVEAKALTEPDDITKLTTIANYKDIYPIRHINVITFLGAQYITIGLNAVFQLWNSKGNRLIHHIKMDDVNETHFFSASAVVKPDDFIDVIFAGDSVGNAYSLIHDKGEYKIELAIKAEADLAITCMCSTKDGCLAIGDAIGRAIIYKVKNNKSAMLLRIIKAESSFPVNCMLSLNIGFDIIVCGYENGIISLHTKNKCVNINAHGRGVTALASHGKKSIIFSTGDDGCFYAFEITGSTEDKLDLEIISCSHIESNLLTGITYCDQLNSVVACAYDYSQLYFWKEIC